MSLQDLVEVVQEFAFVHLAVDREHFVDTELFGQSPMVDFLESLGFEYSDERAVEGSGYLYVLKYSTLNYAQPLTSQLASKLLSMFPDISLYHEAEGEKLIVELPLSLSEELQFPATIDEL